MSVRQAPPTNSELTQNSQEANVDPVGGKTNVFGTTGRATDYFVGQGYRQYQRETIEESYAAYEQGYRYVVVDAGTGTGKSHIARALAFQSGDAHIITIQKLLQDQYQNDFPDMFVMKGRRAYTCLMGDPGDSCADGPCQRKKMVSCTTCPYLQAKSDAMGAAVTVHNFDSFYYQNSYGGGFSGRKLLVVDEAHNISNKFTDFLSFTLDSSIYPVPEFERLDDYDGFVKEMHKELSAEARNLNALHAAEGLMNKDQLRRMKDLNGQLRKMKIYMNEREKDNPAEFVFDYTEYGRNAPRVTFRPVFVGNWARRWLFEYGERVLLMSATILDKKMFCREVGLDPDEVYYIRVPSTFPPENRPILKKYAGSMSYKNIDETLPKIAELVQEIADKFPGKKGIVQTHSEKIASYLQSNLYDSRFTFNKDFRRPQDMLESHRRKDGSIIIASGLREGLDLRGELSKVQIFCKIPYPSLGDKVVRRKLELDERWYGWITTVNLVQMLGRSVRSPNEKAVTYILDSGFGFFYKKNKRFLPGYIKEAIRW